MSAPAISIPTAEAHTQPHLVLPGLAVVELAALPRACFPFQLNDRSEIQTHLPVSSRFKSKLLAWLSRLFMIYLLPTFPPYQIVISYVNVNIVIPAAMTRAQDS